MELDEELNLLGDSDAPSREAWDAAAAAVLRRARLLADDEPDTDAAARLDRTTLDGVVVPALGTAADGTALPPIGEPGAAPYTRGSTFRAQDGWDIRAHLAQVDRERAAAEAQRDLGNGVTSLWVTVGATGTVPTDLDVMLADVHLDVAPVVIEADITVDPLAAARILTSTIDDRSGAPDPRTNLGVDPVGRLARYGRGPGGAPDDVASVVATAAGLATSRGIAALVVDATVVHDAGGGDADELGYALATGVTYLRALEEQGTPPESAAGLIEFRFAATDEQFLTIAKLRAARMLWHRVTEAAGFAVPLRSQRQHAVTSRPMTTRYDPWVNMLRTTVGAFAAGVGGADAVTVLPYDHALGQPDPLSRRIARNTSSLLVHESHIARVTDPVGGAYAVETLTDRLARAGWERFQHLERSGGVVSALTSGELADRIADVSQRRRTSIAHRERPITGVSSYPLADEALPPRRAWPTATITPGPGALPTVSYADDFESLRDRRMPTPVLVATVGPMARHTARTSFVSNLLTAGGIPVVTGAADSYADTAPAVVVLAGSDGDYEELAADAVKRMRARGAEWIVVAGTPPATVADLVDDTVRAGDDTVAFLQKTRSRLQEAN